jgi:hypothetical protein
MRELVEAVTASFGTQAGGPLERADAGRGGGPSGPRERGYGPGVRQEASLYLGAVRRLIVHRMARGYRKLCHEN